MKTFTNDLDSEIRVGFDPGDGAWSWIGTDARKIPQGERTMNLGFLDRGTAAHEFGHALGLGHEHQNPAGGIEWNEDVVIRDLSGPPNNWTVAQIRHNVLDKYRADQIRALQVGLGFSVMFITHDLGRMLQFSDRVAVFYAARLVEVAYEALPVCLHPHEAAQPGAPLTHPDLGEYHHDALLHPLVGTNICHQYQLQRGDVEAAFARAALVVENEADLFHRQELQPAHGGTPAVSA